MVWTIIDGQGVGFAVKSELPFGNSVCYSPDRTSEIRMYLEVLRQVVETKHYIPFSP